MASIYLFFCLPVFLWFVPYILMFLARIKISLSDYLKNFSLVFLPVIAGLFTGLIIMEIVTRLPYYNYIIHDVRGVDTIRKIITKQIIIPSIGNWLEWSLFLTMIAASLLGILVSLKIIKKLKLILKIHDNRFPVLQALPFAFVLIFFAEVIIYRAF